MRALTIEVSAEGIESPTQPAARQAMGCDMGQGYLLGHRRWRHQAAD